MTGHPARSKMSSPITLSPLRMLVLPLPLPLPLPRWKNSCVLCSYPVPSTTCLNGSLPLSFRLPLFFGSSTLLSNLLSSPSSPLNFLLPGGRLPRRRILVSHNFPQKGSLILVNDDRHHPGCLDQFTTFAGHRGIRGAKVWRVFDSLECRVKGLTLVAIRFRCRG